MAIIGNIPYFQTKPSHTANGVFKLQGRLRFNFLDVPASCCWSRRSFMWLEVSIINTWLGWVLVKVSEIMEMVVLYWAFDPKESTADFGALFESVRTFDFKNRLVKRLDVAVDRIEPLLWSSFVTSHAVLTSKNLRAFVLRIFSDQDF